jgi:hypothetical protein
LMECAVASDLSVSQLIRHLIRKYVFWKGEWIMNLNRARASAIKHSM